MTREQIVEQIVAGILNRLAALGPSNPGLVISEVLRGVVRDVLERADRDLDGCLQPTDEDYPKACALADALQRRLESVDSTKTVETFRMARTLDRGLVGVFLTIEQARALVELIDRRTS